MPQASFAQQQPAEQQLQPRQSAFAAQQAQSLESSEGGPQDGSSMRSPTVGPMAAALGQALMSPMSGEGVQAEQQQQQRTASAQLPSPRFQGFGPLAQQQQQGSQSMHGVPSSPLPPQSGRLVPSLSPQSFDHPAIPRPSQSAYTMASQLVLEAVAVGVSGTNFFPLRLLVVWKVAVAQ